MGIYRHFPYTNFHEMNLDEIIKIVKQMLEDWAQYYDTWDDWKTQVTNEWSEMQSFINHYFDNLNVQTEINNKITAMVNSGEFSQIVDPYIPPAVSAWLAEHITTPETVVIDDSLTIEGACADAKATGSAIDALKLNDSYLSEGYTPIQLNFEVNGYSLYSQYFPRADENWFLHNSDNAHYEYCFYLYDGGYDYVMNTSWITSADYEINVVNLMSGYSYEYFKIRFRKNDSTETPISDKYVLTAKKEGKLFDLENEFSEIKDFMLGEYTAITNPTQTSGGYYTAVIGSAIVTEIGSGYYCDAVDLSAYVGYKVRVAFVTDGTISTRVTALCDSNGIVGTYVEEKVIANQGYADFDISETYNQLYISFNTGASNLSINIVEGGKIYLIDSLPQPHVYVSDTTGSDNNGGSEFAPFATLQKAIDSGASIISVKAGEYAGFTVKDRINPLTIMLWDMPIYSAIVPDVPKIKITTELTSGYGIYADNCASLFFSDIWVDGVSKDCMWLQNIGYIECVRCYCTNNSVAGSMGIRILRSNGRFINCIADSIVKDGFNIHGYGNTEFIDCKANSCGDDGISHHDGCTGVIIGGEFTNCAKAGIASPYGGAKVDIHNAYVHDNTQYGIYAYSEASLPESKCNISNCVIKDNGTYDIYSDYADIVAWNNLYDTKVIGPNSAYVEY